MNRTLYIEAHKREALGLCAPDVNRDDETTYHYTEAETASAMRCAQQMFPFLSQRGAHELTMSHKGVVHGVQCFDMERSGRGQLSDNHQASRRRFCKPWPLPRLARLKHRRACTCLRHTPRLRDVTRNGLTPGRHLLTSFTLPAITLHYSDHKRPK